MQLERMHAQTWRVVRLSVREAVLDEGWDFAAWEDALDAVWDAVHSDGHFTPGGVGIGIRVGSIMFICFLRKDPCSASVVNSPNLTAQVDLAETWLLTADEVHVVSAALAAQGAEVATKDTNE